MRGTGKICENQKEKLWNMNFILVLVFGFIAGTANQMINPQLSKYAHSLGASLALSGTIVGVFSAIAMIMRPLSGAASDTLPRKMVMVCSVLMSAMAFAGYLIFKNITAVIICRVIQGISFAFLSVARTAYATEFIPQSRLGEGVAFANFGVLLSQALGPAAGLLIADKWGYDTCFAFSLAFTLLGALVLIIQPYKQHVKKKVVLKDIRIRNFIAIEIIPYALIAGLFSMITQMSNAFLALIGDARNIANVGIFFTVYSICALVFRPFSGRILDKHGLAVLIYPAHIFAAITFILIGAAQSIFVIVIAGLCKALSQGIALPSLQGASIKRLGKEHAGVSSATIYMGTDFINAIAPAAGGVLASNYGYGKMFYIFAGVTLLGIPMFMYLRRKDKKRVAVDI